MCRGKGDSVGGVVDVRVRNIVSTHTHTHTHTRTHTHAHTHIHTYTEAGWKQERCGRNSQTLSAPACSQQMRLMLASLPSK